MVVDDLSTASAVLVVIADSSNNAMFRTYTIPMDAHEATEPFLYRSAGLPIRVPQIPSTSSRRSECKSMLQRKLRRDDEMTTTMLAPFQAKKRERWHHPPPRRTKSMVVQHRPLAFLVKCIQNNHKPTLSTIFVPHKESDHGSWTAMIMIMIMMILKMIAPCRHPPKSRESCYMGMAIGPKRLNNLGSTH